MALLLAGLLAGCASSVTLDTPTIPQPLTDRIPISVGLRIPSNFDQFVHEESVFGREEWTIDLGGANAALFKQLFGHMFDHVSIVGKNDDPKSLGIDALVEPTIDAFEFSTPAQSKTEAFAVWIRYRIKVFDRDGTLVSNWPVSAYGKSLATTMNKSDALQRAAILAMRDAAALMVMKLDEVTGISKLGNSIPSASTPVSVQTPVSADEDKVQTSAREGQQDDAS
jgi:hypothetical protein